MPEKILLISASQVPRAIAILRHVARDRVAAGAIVDAFDTYPAIGSKLSYYTRRDRFYERVAGKYRRFVRAEINGCDLTDTIDLSHVVVPPLPATIGALRAASFCGAKVGLAALSITATHLKIAEREDVAVYGTDIAANWAVAHLAAEAASRIDAVYDAIYVFNGREAVSRPFCDILEQKARLIRFEIGGAPDTFILTEASVHDPENIALRVRRHDPDEEAGIRFFAANRSRGPDAYALRFSGAQVRGLLPELSGERPLVVMFTSSEDEHFAITDEASYGDYPTQFALACALARICAEQGKALVVRLHPHLSHKDAHWRREWNFEELERAGAHVIMPEDAIDSYALADAADVVVTCGSTIGIEAAYSGRPSLMVGRYPATILGICEAATTRDDIAGFLQAPHALPNARDTAVRYASFLRTSGTPIADLADGGSWQKARLSGKPINPVPYFLHRLSGVVRRGIHRLTGTAGRGSGAMADKFGTRA